MPRKSLAVLALCAALWSVFSPVAPFVTIRERFTYAETVSKISIANAPTYAVSASVEKLPNLAPSGYETSGVLNLNAEAGSFVLSVPESFAAENESDLTAVFSVGDRSEVRGLDMESTALSAELAMKDSNLSETVPHSSVSENSNPPMRNWKGFLTEPSVFPPTKTVSYRILSKKPLPQGVRIIATDLRSKSAYLSVDPVIEASAATGGDRVIHRADWGADESWRYEDSPVWKAALEKLAAAAEKPETAEAAAYRQKVATIENHLKTGFAEQYASVETVREENGHKLVWPLEKTKRVEKVIVHHTAENNLKDLSDAELLRSTYRYHSISRGWGDIGYNYVIGQRGEIYEGRAGGDYVVWAHVSWNNRSTVGVSVIGNFEVDNLNVDQERGLKTALELLAKKYGIDYSKTSYSHKECLRGKDCVIGDSVTPNLIGHRDAGYTSCPGKNLYALLANLRQNATYSIGLVAVDNPRMRLAASVSNSALAKGPTVRVRLSYDKNPSVTIEGYSAPPRFGAGTISGTLAKNLPLRIDAEKNGNLRLVLSEKKIGSRTVKKWANLGTIAFFESSALRVKSWDRKPSWDKSGTMNDNIFRGKIEIRNENGNIVLINELPLEDYLKGLGEVSNGDNAEKVKTILVAARSYAYFYLQKENRKFPGAPYDASDDPNVFQKYLGYGLELRSSDVAKLVDATNGEMITYSGSVVKPWYFNESDGKTLSYVEYCRLRIDSGSLPKNTECKEIPYLKGAVDPGGVGHTRKGHGVGISGIGATYFATNLEWKYPQIIGYYLDGTEVAKKY